ncbi:MAG: helix-turn-helix transcriptional regulator [Clostridia bacterium]|nr:helix-turn-helix transcriptional regulator [Clostridia bacterium]
MKLGEMIRIFRIANGYTMKQLAESSCLSTVYISELETMRKKNPSSDTIEKLASAFNISTEQLFEVAKLSEEGKWNFQKTLLEVLKIYVR